MLLDHYHAVAAEIRPFEALEGSTMRASKRGIQFILDQEGCRLHPYQDQVGKWTIGVGHLIAAGEDLMRPISKQECSDLLARDVARFEREIANRIPVSLNQNQFDALISLTFNCGPGPLTGGVGTALNDGDYDLAADRFLDWRNAGGKPILLARREKERELFLEPVPSPEPMVDEEQVLANIGLSLHDMVRAVDLSPHAHDTEPAPPPEFDESA